MKERIPANRQGRKYGWAIHHSVENGPPKRSLLDQLGPLQKWADHEPKSKTLQSCPFVLVIDPVADIPDVCPGYGNVPIASSARKRAINAIQSVEARPKMIRKTVFDASPNINIGRSPNLSDRDPRSGVNRNCPSV